MNKRQLKKAAMALTAALTAVLPAVALAQLAPPTAPPGAPAPQDIRVVVARLIQTAMSLLGIIAVIIVLYGGFTWMTAGGNEERIGKAKQILTAGIIGLIIVASAYGIATFVITSLISATQPGA
jgi:hypothetical protein